MLERLTEGVTTGLQNKSAEQRQQETKGNQTRVGNSFRLFTVVSDVAGISSTTGKIVETLQQLMTSSTASPEDVEAAEMAMRRTSSSFDAMNDRIASELIEGELDASDSPSLQNRVGKIAGSALNGSSHSVGEAHFEISSNFSAQGCQVFIVSAQHIL